MLFKEYFLKKFLVYLLPLIIFFTGIVPLYASSLKDPNILFIKNFNKLKEHVNKKDHNFEKLYEYSQANASKLSKLTYKELGPVAAKALGDLFYKKEDYDRAIKYYEEIKEDSPGILEDYRDRIDLNLSYIYFKKKEWMKAIELSRDFEDAHPDSEISEEAAGLFYLSAASYHRKNVKSISSYWIYIGSLKKYINVCKNNCPFINEARYNLGKHFERNNSLEDAIAEYLSIDKTALNYISARYDALRLYIREMEQIKLSRDADHEKIESLYKKGVELLNEYRDMVKELNPLEPKEVEPSMILLEAGLHLLKPDNDYKAVLDIVKNFEKRFSKRTDLHLRAKVIRIACYQGLGLEKRAEEEIDNIANFKSVDREGFIALREFAEKLNHEADIAQDMKKKELAYKNRINSLMIYKKLYAISKLNADYRKYRNSLLFKMVKIYMSEGQWLNAIELYKNILKADPLSADEIYALGLLYEGTGQWEEALRTWRKFSDGVKPGTDHWFEARYRTAVALKALGKIDKACDILTVTLLLHSDMGNEKLTRNYIELKESLCGSN